MATAGRRADFYTNMVQDAAWKRAAVTRAHERQTAYTARLERQCGEGEELYSVAIAAIYRGNGHFERPNGRRFVWHQVATGLLYCEQCHCKPCEHSGAVLSLAEIIHARQRTWTNGQASETTSGAAA